MAKLIKPDVFRKRYFERGGPTDEELKQGVENGTVRGTIICGQIYIADDALFNQDPWQPEEKNVNPLLAKAS